MNIPPFADLNILKKSLRFLYKTNTLRKFFFGRINWVLIYGPPRTGTSLLARLFSYQSKSMFVDVGLHFARKYPESAKWNQKLSRKYYLDIYFNLLINAHEGAWFHKKCFSRPIDLVVKEAALRVDDYYLLCDAFGFPSRKIFCIREPSSYSSSHAKKFERPDNINNDYLNALNAYDEIGGEIFEYNSEVSLATYENILFGKELGIPTELNFKKHKKSLTGLEDYYDDFKRKNYSSFTTI